MRIKSIGIGSDFLLLNCRMELTPFSDFKVALDKALGKLGSQPKQVIQF